MVLWRGNVGADEQLGNVTVVCGIDEQNTAISNLAAPRNDFMQKYNNEVKDRNDVVAKYNDLVKQVEKQQRSK